MMAISWKFLDKLRTQAAGMIYTEVAINEHRRIRN